MNNLFLSKTELYEAALSELLRQRVHLNAAIESLEEALKDSRLRGEEYFPASANDDTTAFIPYNAATASLNKPTAIAMPKPKRTMSTKGRAAVSAAQKRRWAAFKAKKGKGKKAA